MQIKQLQTPNGHFTEPITLILTSAPKASLKAPLFMRFVTLFEIAIRSFDVLPFLTLPELGNISLTQLLVIEPQDHFAFKDSRAQEFNREHPFLSPPTPSVKKIPLLISNRA